MTAATINLPRGGQRAVDHQKEEKAARAAASSFKDWDYLKLADNESIILRLVTDEPDWIETKMHFVKTKPAPTDIPEGKKWPAKFGSVCRYAPGFESVYDECFICDHTTDDKGNRPYAGTKMFALAVEREEDGNGGFQDKLVERKVYKDGKETDEIELVPHYFVLNFGFKNFFNKLLGFKAAYKTVVDRDYLVTRIGTDQTTDYTFAPLDKVNAPDGTTLDLRKPEHAALYENKIDLQAIVVGQTTDEYYGRFFDTRVTLPYSRKKDSDGTATATQDDIPAATPETGSDEAARKARMDALKQRVAKH